MYEQRDAEAFRLCVPEFQHNQFPRLFASTHNSPCRHTLAFRRLQFPRLSIEPQGLAHLFGVPLAQAFGQRA